MDRDESPCLAVEASPPPEPAKHRLRLRLEQWSQVLSLCDSAEKRGVELEAVIDDPAVDDAVLVELILPGGLAARVGGVISHCRHGRSTIAVIGMTPAFCQRLRALAAPDEPTLAAGSGTMKVDELNSSLRRQIDLLASKMTPHK